MLWILKFLPRNHISHLFGQLMHIQWPKPINRFLILQFAKSYHINLIEAEKEISAYPSIGDFFVRKLKPEARILGKSETLHPCDAVITQAGRIDNGQLIQAKGKIYSLSALLDDKELASQFSDGFFFTYYLCPTDYHRVHSPVDGKIKFSTHIPGSLWPVNKQSVASVAQLFSVNERIVVGIETRLGLILAVFVGATNVGQIQMSFDEDMSANDLIHISKRTHDYAAGLEIQKGEELGYFRMGSTVVMIYPASFSTLFTSDKLNQLAGLSVHVKADI